MSENEFVLLKKEDLSGLLKRLDQMEERVKKIEEKRGGKEYYNLIEACKLKNISYKSLTTAKYKHNRPMNGTPDKVFNNRDYWSRETIERWLTQDDNELLAQLRRRVS